MVLTGKRGLVVGIANEHSIAFGCARTRSRTPEHQLVTIEDIGNFAAFLVSDGAAALTGNVEYIDSGYHILG
jgi:enoyl-[acyl-carrier-protein] reductase (NADH)